MLVLWLLGYYFILFFSKNHPAGAEVNVGKRPCFVLKTQVVDATPGWLDRQRPRRSARSPVGGNISLGLAGEPRAAGAQPALRKPGLTPPTAGAARGFGDPAALSAAWPSQCHVPRLVFPVRDPRQPRQPRQPWFQLVLSLGSLVTSRAANFEHFNNNFTLLIIS